MSPAPSSDNTFVDQIAAEIFERRRGGETLSAEEYYRRYPEHQEVLRSFLPALLAVENLKPNSADESRSPEPSTRIDSRLVSIGDYRIVRELGRGGMGIVYEAEQESLGRRVALKVLARNGRSQSTSAERFEREARAAARMHHTNIVPVFDVGQDQEYAYYAMQLIRGQSLDLVIDELKRLRNESSTRGELATNADRRPDTPNQSIAESLILGQFQQDALIAGEEVAADRKSNTSSTSDPDPDATATIAHQSASTVTAALPGQSDVSTAETNRRAFYHSVARIGWQTADAAAYAHARGVIHRDIKPSNLILDAAGVVWVTDFGLAKTGDHGMTHSGDILGTIRYMSPERFTGQCDVRADIYSLGLTLYELLTLQPAFRESDQMTLVEKVRRSDPPKLRGIDPRIPRDLETIVLKSIDKDPKHRYQSADELCEDLRRFIHDEPITARRTSVPERLIRWSLRNRGLAAALASACLLLISVTVVSIAAAQTQKALAEDNRNLADDNELRRQSADQARKEAEEKNDQLERLLLESRARHLATQSELKRRDAPLQSILLGMEAVDCTAGVGEEIVGAAHDALLNAVANVGGTPLSNNAVWTCTSPDDRWLFIANADGKGALWDLTLEQPLPVSKNIAELLHPRDFKLGYSGTSGRITPDGRWLITGGWQIPGRMTNLRADEPPQALPGYENGTGAIAVSRNGKFFVIVRADGQSADVWDLESSPQKTQRVLRADNVPPPSKGPTPDGPFGWLTISDDGRWIAATGRNRATALLWDLQANRDASPWTLTDHESHVNSVSFSPQGRWLITTSGDTTTRLWNLKSSDPTSNSMVFRAHKHPVNTAEISRDGRWLVTAGGGSPLSGRDSEIYLWDLDADNPTASGRPLLGHRNSVGSVAFSPDSRRLVTGGYDKTVRVWDLASEHPASTSETLRGHEGGFSSILAISPNNRWLVTSTFLSKGNGPRLWDLQADHKVSGEHILPSAPTHISTHSQMVVTPDNRFLIAGHADHSVRLWELSENRARCEILTGHQDEVLSFAVSSSGKWLATGSTDKTARVWNLQANDFPSLELRGHDAAVRAVAISPSGARVITAGDDGARVWDLRDRASVTSISLEGRAERVAVTDKWAIIVRRKLGYDGEILMLDLAAEEPTEAKVMLREKSGRVRSIATTPDGRWLATASNNGRVRVWDLAHDRPETSMRVLGQHPSTVTGVAITPDGRWLASSCDDGSARLWDLQADDPTVPSFVLRGHEHYAWIVAISANGRWLATGSADGTARVWDMHSKNPSTSARVIRAHDSGVPSVAISPNGRWLATKSFDNTIRTWDLDIDSLVERGRQLAGRALTTAEKEEYLLTK